ncbi:uncharacterized protein RAG0_12133 [Rhynchosporium agropyri]|uniref:Uncharacterized protein n=1 Tax=Rhynchosporium agropyri TaxID=914238 RepID=A0A1E1L770_9HELO|nr:uncharacterized protein RAG0_12133 [Rhynchosporium agropyri]
MKFTSANARESQATTTTTMQKSICGGLPSTESLITLLIRAVGKGPLRRLSTIALLSIAKLVSMTIGQQHSIRRSLPFKTLHRRRKSYVHVRVGGQGMKNLRMFRKVCGEKKLGSVYLSTRSWEESGEEILDYLLTQSWMVTLDIQHEMVDEGKKLVETNAGRELQAEIEKIKEAHKKEMLEIREDMEEAIKTQDTERQVELRR